jgi:hypothetical protein
MLKEMCWMSAPGTNGQKILHLRTEPHKAWLPYTAYPHYAVPDYKIPGGSKGWATYQRLRTQGWTLQPSQQPQYSSLARV